MDDVAPKIVISLDGVPKKLTALYPHMRVYMTTWHSVLKLRKYDKAELTRC